MNKDDLKKDDLSHEVQETEIIKNESENITDENSDKANDGSELNDSHDDNSKKNKKKKSKKELSNGLKALRLLLIIVVVLVGVIYMRGGFYFVKDKELSHEGQKAYESATETTIDLFEKVTGKEAIEENLGSQMSPGGLAPYGFWVNQDNGVEGDENGLQKELESGLGEISDNYGGPLKMYFLKNEDYAKKYYNDFKLQTLGPVVDEYDFPNGQIAFGQADSKQGSFIVFRKGTVVYYVMPVSKKEYKDASKLMDLLDIDYEFPKFDDLWK